MCWGEIQEDGAQWTWGVGEQGSSQYLNDGAENWILKCSDRCWAGLAGRPLMCTLSRAADAAVCEGIGAQQVCGALLHRL